MFGCRRIDPTLDELCQSLLARLERSSVPYPVKTPGWMLPLAETPPVTDLSRPANSYAGSLNPQPLADRVISCANYFPNMGGMDWHTDSHRPGWRLYVYRLVGTARFRYGHRTFDESTGCGAYIFQTGVGCWHSVESFGERLSCGVHLSSLDVLPYMR